MGAGDAQGGEPVAPRDITQRGTDAADTPDAPDAPDRDSGADGHEQPAASGERAAAGPEHPPDDGGPPRARPPADRWALLRPPPPETLPGADQAGDGRAPDDFVPGSPAAPAPRATGHLRRPEWWTSAPSDAAATELRAQPDGDDPRPAPGAAAPGLRAHPDGDDPAPAPGPPRRPGAGVARWGLPVHVDRRVRIGLVAAAALVLLLGAALMTSEGGGGSGRDHLVNQAGRSTGADAATGHDEIPPSQPAVPVSFAPDGQAVRPEADRARVVDEATGDEVVIVLPPGSTVVDGVIVPGDGSAGAGDSTTTVPPPGPAPSTTVPTTRLPTTTAPTTPPASDPTTTTTSEVPATTTTSTTTPTTTPTTTG